MLNFILILFLHCFKSLAKWTDNHLNSICIVGYRYLISCHTTDYNNPWLFLNTLAVMVLVIAKFPNMHRVRIFGINADYAT